MQTKKRLLLLILVSLLTVSIIFFQVEKESSAAALLATPAAPPVEWTKTYGGTGSQGASSVQQTSDDGYVLFGKSELSGWIVKVDSKGAMQWNRTFSKSGFEMDVRDGRQTSDGGYMLVGGLRDTVGSGAGDAFLIKTDGTGATQWERAYGGSGHEYAFSGQQTNDGGYVLTGVSAPAGVNNDDFYLIKTDPSGNAVWSKTFGVTTANEIAWSDQQTSDGGYIIAGEALSFTASWPDAWIVKTDQNGNMLWSKTFSQLGKGRLNSVKQTNDGGYIVAGDYNSQPETGNGKNNDFWLMKLNNNGNVQWNTYFGEGDRYESAKCAQQTTDGGFIAIGRSGTTNIWLIKTDSAGAMIWNKTFATFSPDESGVIQTSDRGYAVACSSPGASQEDAANFMLIKIMRANPPVSSCTVKPSNPMVGQEVVFNASATYDLDNDIRSYTWNFDDANISTTTEPTVSHSFSSPDNYNVTLTVTDNEDLTSSISQEICARINTSISFSASSRITSAGLAVNITGALRDMLGQLVANKTVVLYYSLSQTREWFPITSATTNTAGIFSGTWLPTGTGQFSIKAEWAGDTIYSPSQNITNLAITLTEDVHLFFVQSNSTLTALMFDSVKKELKFTVDGPSGTVGYVNALIPKNLIEGVADVKIYLDGNKLDYEVSSFDDSWLFHFTYSHSTHAVVIGLATGATLPFETPLGSLILIVILIVAICAGTAYYFLRKRNRTKQNKVLG